jgi:glyoxylase-like metal-dependent hydrolase (beta-lactamase superfamily II)
VEELAPGLRRWTARHEEWKEDVASLAVETDGGLALIDPLEPPQELGRAEHVLLTVSYHARSTKAVGAPHVWAAQYAVRPLANRGIEVTDVVSPEAALPGGIRAFQTPRRSEVVYWLPEQRSVVVGDVLLAAGARPKPTDEPLRLCPERWLGSSATHADLRESLAPLLELPVERVLCAHGEPVLSDGLRELERVLAK